MSVVENPFVQNPPVVKPDRNAFDLSFANNLTMKMGYLYPVMCKEVIPGDTFNIEASFGLRFMPLLFPVQSRVRADIHFFYVRNRNLWKNWQDFIGRTKEGLIFPYIDQKGSGFFSTGSLSDYLGVPTAFVSNSQTYLIANSTSSKTMQDVSLMFGSKILANEYAKCLSMMARLGSALNIPNMFSSYSTTTSLNREVYGDWFNSYRNGVLSNVVNRNPGVLFDTPLTLENSKLPLNIKFNFTYTPTDSGVYSISFYGKPRNRQLKGYSNNPEGLNLVLIGSCLVEGSKIKNVFTFKDAFPITVSFKSNLGFTMSFQEFLKKYLSDYESIYIGLASSEFTNTYDFCTEFSDVLNYSSTDAINKAYDSFKTCSGFSLASASSGSGMYDNLDDTMYSNDLRISALPFRAYESIYNSFYRNQQNNPFKINGTIEYNKFVTTDDDGADATPYTLYRRNWEQDFMTSCLPSPQQGTAPLLGARTNVQSYEITDSTGQKYVVNTSDNTVTGITSYDGSIDESTIKALNSAVEIGISINDLRNVNSLQRWLEINAQRGYRYKDQILSHFGVEIECKTLDMPEYLGGFSEDVNINAIYQQEQTDIADLGSFAGVGTCMARSQHQISRYCDEHGFIIGILSVVPIPSYSQLLPKYFTKFNALDYFFPEFNHLGFQPVPIKEVSPLQAKLSNIDVNRTFGYNRAWYDYLKSTDEVHGLFRTNLRNFLINRVFGSVPELSPDFIEIDPAQVNDVFVVTDSGDDKILGQVYFKCIVDRPISKYGTPRLE